MLVVFLYGAGGVWDSHGGHKFPPVRVAKVEGDVEAAVKEELTWGDEDPHVYADALFALCKPFLLAIPWPPMIRIDAHVDDLFVVQCPD